MIVVDASVLVTALAGDAHDGPRARAALAGRTLAAPELVDLEVVSVLRRLTASGQLTLRRAHAAIDDLTALPIERAAHAPLLHRCWELRANLTVYDAAYVALAETLDAPLVTADARLANAPGVRCDVEVLT